MRTTHFWYSNAPRFGLLRSEKAFAQRDIEDMIAREVPPIIYSARDPTLNTQHVFLAVDPSGGGASAFSIATIVQGPQGFMHVRPLLNLHCVLQIHAHAFTGP